MIPKAEQEIICTFVRTIILIMKYCLVLITVLLFSKLNAQQQNDSIIKNSYGHISCFDFEVWKQWNPIDSVWMHKEYWKILADFHLKMKCSYCDGINMNVDMVIDSNGKLSRHTVINSNKCGKDFDKKLEDAFMKYFYGITFPAIFRKRICIVMLGTALKC
jgi:hypothetical protein